MSGRSFLLTNWITIRGGSAVTGVTQDADEYIDVASFADLTFYIDVSEVTVPSGGTNGAVLLYLETSPTLDESLFTAQPLLGPIPLSTTTSPFVAKTASGGAVGLCRYVRWRIVATLAASWDVTMRIRAVGNRSPYFAPTQLGGCALWLRADLGVTLASTGQSITGWADQSGQSRNATGAGGGGNPGYSISGINGFPAIIGNGTSQYMTTTSFSVGSSATIIAVAQPAVSPQTGYCRIIEQQYDHSYYLGVDLGGTHYKLIVDSSIGTFGNAVGGAVTAATTAIISGTFAAPTGTLYINGTSVASDSTNFGTPGVVNTPFYIMQAYNGFAEYWSGSVAEVIIYNRALNAQDFKQVHRYIGARYGVSVP